MGISSGHSGRQHSPFPKCCSPSVPCCVIQIPMIHLSQKSPEYLKLTGKSTKSRLASGQGNTRCDLGESRSWYDVDTQSNNGFENKIGRNKTTEKRGGNSANQQNTCNNSTFFLVSYRRKGNFSYPWRRRLQENRRKTTTFNLRKHKSAKTRKPKYSNEFHFCSN